MLEPQINNDPPPTSKIVTLEKPKAPKNVTFANTIEQLPPSQQNDCGDPPVILHTRDPRKEDHPPFYMSLMIGDLLLHNCMLDSGSESNIMTKKVMQQLGLRTTRPYQNVCAIDSRPIKVEGMIERQHVRLAKYPDIHVTMYILVIDVSDKWGMLLSRKFGATLGGSIQMDWTYATVPASED